MIKLAKEDKVIFYFSMLFLLLVTVTLINSSFKISEAIYGERPLLSPQTVQKPIFDLRAGVLFIIINSTVLFFIIFYCAVVLPNVEKILG